jgi:hypothetical protein
VVELLRRGLDARKRHAKMLARTEARFVADLLMSFAITSQAVSWLST